MRAQIVEFIVGYLDGELGVGRDDALSAENLFDVGIDSILFVNLVNEFEKKFSVSLNESDLVNLSFMGVNGMADALVAMSPSA